MSICLFSQLRHCLQGRKWSMCLGLLCSVSECLVLSDQPWSSRRQCADVSDPDHNGCHNGKCKHLGLSTKSSQDKVLNMYERAPWHQQEISQTLAENKSLWKNKPVMLLGLKTLSLKVPKQSQRIEWTKYWKGNLLLRAEDLEVERGSGQI